MSDNKASSAHASREKDLSHGKKTFRIPVSNGIFDHYAQLKDAMWLLLLFVDWTTKEYELADGSRDGLVWGGKPIRDEDITSAFHGQICTRTARRWRQRLARLGYIAQKRTPVGYVIRVKKSKKLAHLDSASPKVIGQKCPMRPDKNVRSEVPVVSGQTGQECPIRSDRNVRSNKDFAVDSALQHKDAAVEATAAAAFEVTLQRQNEKHWKRIGILPIGSRAFREMWKLAYDKARDGEELSDIMERCIQTCQDSGVAVPPPFFEAKRALERGSTGDGAGMPKLEPFSRNLTETLAASREQERREQLMPSGLPKLEPIRR